MFMKPAPDHRRRNTGMGNTSSSIPVQGVMDFPIVSSFYQPSFESPKSFKVVICGKYKNLNKIIKI